MENYDRLRTYSYADPKDLDADGHGSDDPDAPTTPIQIRVPMNEANLAASLITDGRHSPVLDIDFPARLIQSSTAGHFHLYLDGIALEWSDYVELLEVLAKVGIIGPGYLKHSLARQQTVVRRPGVMKGRSVVPPVPVGYANDDEPF